MATMISPYERVPIAEVIPDSMKLRGLAKASVLTGRRRVRVIPQTGQAYNPSGGQSLANILIQDSAGLLDLQSVVLSFRLLTTSANGSLDPAVSAVPDDFAWSIIRRLQVSLNSQLLDDVDYCGRRATMEAYTSCSKSWYETVGTLMGAWKFVSRPEMTFAAASGAAIQNSAAAGALVNASAPAGTVITLTQAPNAGAGGAVTGSSVPGGAIVFNAAGTPQSAIPHPSDVASHLFSATMWFKNVVALSNGAAPPVYSWASNTGNPGGQVFSIPLAMLSHFFRSEQYFPLRNAGQLLIQVLFDQPQNCLYNAGNAQAASYQVSDLNIECDVLTCHPEYTSMLDEICARPEREGLAFGFDAHLVSIAAPSGAATSPGSQQTFTVIASKATQNCRALHWVMQPAASQGRQNYLQQSTYNCNDTNQWQIRIGSVYYPAFPSQGLSRNYMELLGSINSQSPSVGQGNLIDYDSWRATTKSDGTVYGTTAILVGNAPTPDPTLYPFQDKFVSGYSFDNLKHAEVLSADGVSTLAMSGSQIQLDHRCTSVETAGVVFTYAIRFTRSIVFAENGVQIVG